MPQTPRTRSIRYLPRSTVPTRGAARTSSLEADRAIEARAYQRPAPGAPEYDIVVPMTTTTTSWPVSVTSLGSLEPGVLLWTYQGALNVTVVLRTAYTLAAGEPA